MVSELEPQFPSIDIAPRLVDDADVEVEVLSDVAVVVEDSSLDEQLPNILWHPAPQYVAFLPQYPFSEQQSPYVLPWQVMLLVDVAPHDPEVLTSCPSSLDEQLPKAD